MPYGTNSALSLSLALVGSEIYGQPNLEGSTVVTFNEGWNAVDLAASYRPESHPLASAGIFDFSASELMSSAVFLPQESAIDQGFEELPELSNSELAQAKYETLLIQNAPTQIQKASSASKKAAKAITEKVGEKIAAAASPITTPVKEVLENVSYARNQINKFTKSASFVSNVFNNSCFVISIVFCMCSSPVLASFAGLTAASCYMMASGNENLQKVILAASPFIMLATGGAAGASAALQASTVIGRTVCAIGSAATSMSAYSMFSNKGQARFAGVIEAITGDKSIGDWINGKFTYPLTLAALAFGRNISSRADLGDMVSNLSQKQLEKWVINMGSNVENRFKSCFDVVLNRSKFASNFKEFSENFIGKSEPSSEKMMSSFVAM